MDIYNYKKANNCFICGEIGNKLNLFIKKVVSNMPDKKKYEATKHQKEAEMATRLDNEPQIQERVSTEPFFGSILRKKKDEGYANSVIIVNGSNLFYGNDLNCYLNKLEILNNVLADNNSHILFVRGSDDPECFEKELINLSNIKTVKDYSVIHFKNFNCLCIGGQISMDRSWKKKQEERFGRRLYWENEKTQYDEEALDEIIREYTISCIITPTCPSFVKSSLNLFRKSIWVSEDNELITDISTQMGVIDNVYHKFSKHKPYIWLYSDVYNTSQSVINDIVFYPIAKNNFVSFQELMSFFFNNKLSEKLNENNSVANGIGVSSVTFSHRDLRVRRMDGIEMIEAPNFGNDQMPDYPMNRVEGVIDNEPLDVEENELADENENNANEPTAPFGDINMAQMPLNERIAQIIENQDNVNNLQNNINAFQNTVNEINRIGTVYDLVEEFNMAVR